MNYNPQKWCRENLEDLQYFMANIMFAPKQTPQWIYLDLNESTWVKVSSHNGYSIGILPQYFEVLGKV